MDPRSGGQHTSHHGNAPQYGRSISTSSLPIYQYGDGSACGIAPLQRQSSYSLTEGFSSLRRGTGFTEASSAPSGNLSTRKHGKTTKTTTKRSQQQASAPVSGSEQTTLGQESREAKEGGQEHADYISPVQKDFEADPAHAFWTWSIDKENWYHKDSTTGAIMWAPLELD